MPIPLEDTWEDVLGKAVAGLGLDPDRIAGSTGLDPEAVRTLLSGTYNEETAGPVVGLLGLEAGRLSALARELATPPDYPLPDGLLAFNTPFGDMTVNSYLVWDSASGEAALFDTGADADPAFEVLRDRRLSLKAVFLTHAHGDHVIELDRLVEKTGATAWIGQGEALPGATGFAAGKAFKIGHLDIETRPTPGHSVDGITYVISGLSQPVAVVGDALFSRSIGGPRISFDQALSGIRQQILTLPDNTLLCPGHGPVTTVAEEKQGNPFFPES